MNGNMIIKYFITNMGFKNKRKRDFEVEVKMLTDLGVKHATAWKRIPPAPADTGTSHPRRGPSAISARGESSGCAAVSLLPSANTRGRGRGLVARDAAGSTRLFPAERTPELKLRVSRGKSLSE